MLQPAGKGARKMNPSELTAAITAAANAMAQTAEDEALNVLSAVFSQLGDTLATIAAQRSFCQSKEENNASG